ncbi:MAG: hypothetical protein Q8M15_14865 [Bacteroidota bacterium]|nr:hypothetical protein [Bacteroidota bacterium]
MIPKKGIPASLQKTFALICFTLYFFLNTSLTKAQTLTVISGPSIPHGLYASTDFTNRAPGLAKLGYHVSLIFEANSKGRTISPFVQYTFNCNQMNEEAAYNFYKFIDDKNKSVQAYKPWNQSILLIGPKFNFFAENFDLNIKAGIGMAWISTFGYTILQDSFNLVNGFSKYNILKASTIAYSIGIGTNLYLNRSVSLSLGYEYFYANAHFGKEKYTDYFGRIKLSNDPVFVEIPFQTSVFYIGIRLQLKKYSGNN